MIFERIPHEEVKKQIATLFPNARKPDWSLEPDPICELAESAGVYLVWRKLGWDNLFANEDGYEPREWDKFKDSIFSNYKPVSGSVIIVPDFSINREDVGYRMNVSDLKEFANTTYSEINGRIEFIEPADYIFYFPDDKYLILIHHHDEITEFQVIP